MRAYISVVILLLHALCAKGQPEALVGEPVRVPPSTQRGSADGTCPSEQDTINAKDELRQNISVILTGLTRVNASTINTICGGTTGWRRVGYLDMTDPSQSCPSGLALKTYSSRLRSCGRAGDTPGCWSTFYNTGGSQYSRVCGRVRGYQFGGTSAFRSAGQGIDSYYVDGVSLTHGQSGSRTHIWTFASGPSETYQTHITALQYCPCVVANATSPPPFVGSDYFCESGLNSAWDYSASFRADDPLWDGQNCISSCCEFNNPPYFTKALLAPTTDNIELRICTNSYAHFDDIPIDQVELYVQ